MSKSLCLALPRHRNSAWVNGLCIHRLRDSAPERPDILPCHGHANLSLARTLLANAARAYDVTLWIDDDIEFDHEEVLRMVSECTPERPVVGAAFATHEPHGRIVVNWLPHTQQVTFFDGGGLYEVAELGFGCIATHRTALDSLAETMPRVRVANQDGAVPYFTAGLGVDGEYLSEAIRFCKDVRRNSLSVWLDSRVRLRHSGAYSYGLEDTLTAVERVPSLTLNLVRK